MLLRGAEGRFRFAKCLSGVLTIAALVLAGWPGQAAASPPPAGSTTSTTTASTDSTGTDSTTTVPETPEPGCHATSCTYQRIGQSLFRVPAGVRLLRVDVVSGAMAPSGSLASSPKASEAPGSTAPKVARDAGTSTTSSTTSITEPPTRNGKHGEAAWEHMEVRGNIVVAPGETTLEVVVGGPNTLGGTVSDIQTSTSSSAKILAAAKAPAASHSSKAKSGQPTPVKAATKAAKSKTEEAKSRSAKPQIPTVVPPGGTEQRSSAHARVSISWVPAGQTLAFTSPAAMTTRRDKPSTLAVTALGPTVPELREAGALPPGLVFKDHGNGTASLVGSPSRSGSFPVTVEAVVGEKKPVVQHVTVVVAGASKVAEASARSAAATASTRAAASAAAAAQVTKVPVFTSAAAVTWTAGTPSTFRVSTSGLHGGVLRERGTLPAGISFRDNGDGTATLGGTPSRAGRYSVEIEAIRAPLQMAIQHLTLTVTQSPSFTSAANVTLAYGTAQHVTVTASGYPTPRLHVVGSMPAGLRFGDNGNGTASVTGTPTNPGSYSVTVVADSSGFQPVEQRLTLVVTQAPAITSPTSVTMPEGEAGTFSVHTIGYPAPTLKAVGNLAPGLTFADNGGGTATLTGTPTESGTSTVELVARNSVGVAKQYLLLTISTAPTTTALSYSQVERTRTGVSLVLTATVDPGQRTPTGTVTFLANPARELGTATLNAEGVATLTVALRPGRHTLVANYHPSPGSGFAASSSSVIGYRATALPVPLKAKKLVVANRGLLGQSVTILGLLAGFLVLVGLVWAVGLWGGRRRRRATG